MNVSEKTPEQIKALEAWKTWEEMGFCKMTELDKKLGLKRGGSNVLINQAKKIRDAERRVFSS